MTAWQNHDRGPITEEKLLKAVNILADLVDGQYERLLRIIAFNTVEGWSRDVTAGRDNAHG